MLYGILLTLFIFISFLLVLIIMIQQGKGSMGLGSLGGSAQMLFGGSGGQDIFQKTTWVLGALFMFGSFALTLIKSHGQESSRYVGKVRQQQMAIAAPATPVAPSNSEFPSTSPVETAPAE